MRNLAFFLGGVLFISAVAIIPEIAEAAPASNDPLTTVAFETGVSESQQILTGVAHSLMFALGVVAGRFR